MRDLVAFNILAPVKPTKPVTNSLSTTNRRIHLDRNLAGPTKPPLALPS